MIEIFQQHFKERGFKEPTAIQTAVNDAMANDKSVLGIAPTGSGKTIAFTLPILPKVMAGQGTQVLVLSPSQELAVQTTKVMREWAQLLDLKVMSLTGGANMKRQVEKLKSHPEILVGTPGRVLHLLESKHLKLGHLQTMIIDEADDMLQDSTLAVIEDIERATPLSTQLGFFSATKTEVLDGLNYMFGRDIIEYDVRDEDHSQGIVRHGQMEIAGKQRGEMLRRFSHIKDFRALVFFNQTKTMMHVASQLEHEHVSAMVLGGQQRNTDREKALRMFRNRQLKFLLTTDVAARGLDIVKLPAVINFDLPTEAVTYVHRVGRTGRQGEPGLVVNFGNDHDLRDLKKLLADEKYDLKPIYFAHNQLVDERPQHGEKPAHTENVQEKAHRAVRKAQLSDEHVNVGKSINRTIDVAKDQPTKAKRHKKKRHDKNKGIRLKRRRQAEEKK
ncbi:DEAD/DEAH box helicase [Paucilactobacillus hokkaidonensis JCM 18461]|uniref:DEAD/DEAH box helicase n=2 Tax=Paucilactobacillus hokkaidonensis TaxID=1193095 RepID=A0A0A1GXL6_9LACO|nr:DEAD/DEAH box helicase [Paucilactobacillus hokkaidonensis]KRO09574.1 ATP-dependent RNA helicase [Paucilactobacillus hokkaidonensis]BAP85201.1 DEAD/DEAH box helicase [Paucilactobacillus hokkaidonensis JCM 18461]